METEPEINPFYETKKQLDACLALLRQLKLVTDPKSKNGASLADIKAIGHKTATLCSEKLEDIKRKL